jgi:glycosyltransferase involved in cell wall biosynthesis
MDTLIFRYSVVIATLDRPGRLRRTLSDLFAQTRPPALVVVVDASGDDLTHAVCAEFIASTHPLSYLRAAAKSSARQRNLGASQVTTPLIAFVDDDVELPTELFASLLPAFSDAQTGGVAARIEGLAHPPPRGLLWLYYRLQAGFAHPHYGGRLFGPALNCLPSYLPDDPELIEADWLNSTCTLYRRDLFERERFPEFDGYSFMEDVHLSHRIARTHRLFFHRDAAYRHVSEPTSFKQDLPRLLRMQLRNRRIIAHDLLKMRGIALLLRFFLLRCFETALLLKTRPPQIREALLALWKPLSVS